jgi:hypothetical protein
MAETPSPSSGTATVLFTDLVGSTELRARLGEVAADDLRRVHDGLLAEAIGAHRGTVVKGLGDGAMASFASAADAVAAAVTIQQAIERHNRHTPDHGLAVRVGVSVGDVSSTRSSTAHAPWRRESETSGESLPSSSPDMIRRCTRPSRSRLKSSPPCCESLTRRWSGPAGTFLL